MSMLNRKVVTLGPEYDEDVKRALRDVLRSKKVLGTESEWAVGGSQELETLNVVVDGEVVVVEAETYIGLTIAGHAGVVDAIAALVRERLVRQGRL